MTQEIDFKRVAMFLLAVSDGLHAALKHKGLEADDITFAVENADGEVRSITTTVEAILDDCRVALGLPRQTVTTTEHEV